jgi:hypothetical protein
MATHSKTRHAVRRLRRLARRRREAELRKARLAPKDSGGAAVSARRPPRSATASPAPAP